MATLSIVKQHGLSHARAKRAAEEVAQDLRERFALSYRWDGDLIRFERPGLSGELRVGAKDVTLECQLGFLLSALKPAIERQVHSEFDRRFGAAAG
jgi:putative polyhydroxyalkanoate system protein